MTGRNIEQALIREGAQQIADSDVEKVVQRSEEIKRKFGAGGPLRRFITDGHLLLSMVKDYWARRYRRVPAGVIGAAVFTLIYVLNPMDLMPDVLPIIGQIDDAALVAACLVLLDYDLQQYQTWKTARARPPQLPPSQPSDIP
jgi:uncharacterized membrane protein YkvA (DUF1232 family)